MDKAGKAATSERKTMSREVVGAKGTAGSDVKGKVHRSLGGYKRFWRCNPERL